MISKPKKINYKNYSVKLNNPKAFYGLEKKVEFCSICTISNQRPVSGPEFKHNLKTKKKNSEI